MRSICAPLNCSRPRPVLPTLNRVFCDHSIELIGAVPTGEVIREEGYIARPLSGKIRHAYHGIEGITYKNDRIYLK